MTLTLRKAVRILLLNDNNELLLMCVEDFDISTPDGARNKRFWCTIGGGIEPGESIQQAAIRELYEETGTRQEEVSIEAVVWHSSIELLIKGILTRLDETFIVARTKKTVVELCAPTEDEKLCVKKLKWFSIGEIINSPDVIFPIVLPKYLPDILFGNYPKEPFEIDVQKNE